MKDKVKTLNITPAEMEIMKLLWQLEKPLNAADIGLGLTHRGWKASTIHTLAMQLERKGVIKYFKVEGRNYYVPYISEFEYNFIKAKDIVNGDYGGSIVDMLSVLLCDAELTKEDFAELKRIIEIQEAIKEATTPEEQDAELENGAAECPEYRRLFVLPAGYAAPAGRKLLYYDSA